MKTEKTYDNNTMKRLKGADKVRLKPSVIFGSDDIEGAKHSLFEIISNSIDEAKEGYGKKIIVTKHKDLSLTVEDYGRGIPLDWNEKEQCYNYEIALCELYGGGKYDDMYENSLGTNGLGLASTQMASEFMTVLSYRDGLEFRVESKHGNITGDLQKTKTKRKETGTIITYKPDKEVFTDINIPIQWIKETLNKQAIITQGVKFIFKDEETKEETIFNYDKGIVEYLNKTIQNPLNKPVYFEGKDRGKDNEDRPEYDFSYQFAFCFTANENVSLIFHNNGDLSNGGVTLNAVKSAFLYSIDKYLKDNKKYQKNDKKISIDDVLDGFSFICNTYSTATSYANQTKTAINNKFIGESLTKHLKKHLEVYFTENPNIANKIANQVLINMKSRTNAEKTRLNIKKQLTEKNFTTNRIKKFIDCRSKDSKVRELYIVEGDSAAGSCKLGRNAEIQAIMPVRGKILNCLKADENKIFASEIIIDLLKIIGCGIEFKSKKNKDLNSFDINNLRYSKIIICTDADYDGYQIRTLILTMLYVLVPTLIKEHKVFIAETPLFEIKIDNKTYFAYSEEEKNKIIKEKATSKSKITLARSKGLGENTPDMMWDTTMNPATRHLICVEETDIELMKETFDLLLGDNLSGRKKYIEDYGKDYVDMID